MPSVKHVAVLGAIAVFGVAGCTAEANTGSPAGASTTAPPDTGSSREDIEVQLQPARAKAGQKVWVLANCPIPQGGPEHRGTASSRIFRTPVTLDPILATATPTPSGTATPVPRPWVRGQATVADGTAAGVYEVNARCEGTNDTGKASLRIVDDSRPSADPTDKPTSKPTRTIISTEAPHTGGGGTAAGGPGDGSMPIGASGALLGVALAGGIGVVIARRRRS
ncbi:hypothetical protein FHS43_000727 [Streptosporangium becharense]|uniref:Uncharacterized protein n=1 Tax=Streptosporangium becharense TaxID=1816182 RepID=A0A7W9IF64_9ACTN|nr:hypothetical protein [Streptosporangium becharense]MBB2909481.1 hypothetical protein [Streptosporangium becharense]MBB5819562.1 hypothetical protein [Streptosporangium becharense]